VKGPPPAPISAEHAELLSQFRRHQERRNLTASSIYSIQGTLRSFVRWLEPDRTIFEVDRKEVESFLDQRRTRDGRAVNSRTRYYLIAHLHGFYKWAMIEDLTDTDPTVKVVRPKMRRVLPRPIDGDALADALRGARPQMRAMLALAAFAGLRCQEIAGLERDDIIEAKALIRVRHGKGQKERIVPLHPDVLEALRVLPMPRTGALFTRPQGGRHTPVSTSQVISDYLRRDCGIDATAHMLRHWFGTEVYDNSKDLRVTQELLGHASPTTTAGYVAYSHVDAAAAVGSLAL
jgi:integrase/recombinase XerC